MKRMMALLLGTLAVPALTGAAASAPRLDLSRLAAVATVDERYQSYNIEMVEVTGGRFWAPYGGPAGERYRQRPALDLADPRMLALARHLAPAYVRVSGTWANNTYLPAEGETVSAPPEGFSQLLTRAQWRGVVAFSRAADAGIITSFAASNGTRGPDGVWRTEQAQRLLDLTRAEGGSLAAAEFFNEPTMPGAAAGMPTPYGVSEYGRDFRIFHDWARRAAPEMLIIGPGGVGVLAMNTGSAPQRLSVGRGQLWLMTADQLDRGDAKVNGIVPELASDGSISGLNAATIRGGRVTLPGQSIAFIAVPGARNQACR